MVADSITFDEGFCACFGADKDCGLEVRPFFVFGGITNRLKGRVTLVDSKNIFGAELENGI